MSAAPVADAADAAPTLADLEAAAAVVYAAMPPTPQYRWPLLDERCGGPVTVKHENHTPVGAFKVRGGLVYLDWLRRAHPDAFMLVTATRGNHGQSIAFAARRHGLHATVVVPHGNSVEKNAAMRALGATLLEEGRDFQEAVEFADAIMAREPRGAHRVPSFDPRLVLGVGTWALELLRADPDVETLYVPIGLGSGICGAIAARDALGHRARIVGVVSAGAPAYALSLERGAPVSHAVTTQVADGMACRTPVPAALRTIARGVERVVRVTDAQVEAAMRALFTDTHNVAEGAGAAALAALLADPAREPGRPAAVVLCGGNVDAAQFARVLAGG